MQIHLSATSPPPLHQTFSVRQDVTPPSPPPPPKIEQFLNIFQKTIKFCFEGDNLAFFSVDEFMLYNSPRQG